MLHRVRHDTIFRSFFLRQKKSNCNQVYQE